MARSETLEDHTLPKGAPQDLCALKALLAAGWHIDPPVLTRPSWSLRSTNTLSYHFIIARETRRSLVVIADSDELHRFLDEYAIAVA